MSPDLEQQTDQGVIFEDVRAAPNSYVGRAVKLDSIVILTKRASDHTELAALELPMEAAGAPTTDRLRSRGRFLALYKASLDLTTVPAGTPIAVIGASKGQRPDCWMKASTAIRSLKSPN